MFLRENNGYGSTQIDWLLRYEWIGRHETAHHLEYPDSEFPLDKLPPGAESPVVALNLQRGQPQQEIDPSRHEPSAVAL